MRWRSRYGHMRIPAFVTATVVVLAACGSSPSSSADSVVETLPPTTTPVTKVPRTTVPADEVAPPTTTEPGTKPDDESSTRPGGVASSRLADALLPDDALPLPWEFQRRDAERIGYGAGRNQTTCPEYWSFESLLGRDGAHAMWWRDGGNANHHVIRMADEGELFAVAKDLYQIAEACPVVKWLEGGSFTTERIELADGLGLRFEDEGSGEVTWVVVTSNGPVLSVLHLPLWTATDGTPPDMTHDELSRLATQMFERVRMIDPTPTPGTTVPTQSTPPPTTEPTLTPPPPTTTEPPVEPSGLAELLLTADELPEGWQLDDLGVYVHSPGDDTFEDCPPARSIDVVDEVLEWEATFTTPSGREAFQIIGAFDSAGEAIDVVDMFGRIADCELDDLFEEADWSGGPETVPSADRAARLTAHIADEGYGGRFDLMLMAVDSVVMVVSYEGPTGDDGAAFFDLAERAAANAAAG